MTLYYGDAPVPAAVMWSGEEEWFVAKCPWFGEIAIHQTDAPGKGVPRFGRPHLNRQRKMMALGLCDICAKPLKTSTKISLSNFGNYEPGVLISQPEPLLHAKCARLSLGYCPSLRRQINEASLRVRQVFRHKARIIVAPDEQREKYVPDHKVNPLFGIAVIDLLEWRDVTSRWLG